MPSNTDLGPDIKWAQPSVKKKKKVKVKPYNPIDVFTIQSPTGPVNPLKGTILDPSPPKPEKKTDWRLDPGGGFVDQKSGETIPLSSDPKVRKEQQRQFRKIKRLERERKQAEHMARVRMNQARKEFEKSLKKEGASLFGWNPPGLGNWATTQLSDIANVPIGLAHLGIENFRTFYAHPEDYPGFLKETAGAFLGNEGGLFTYVPDPTDPEDLRKFRDAWREHTVMGGLMLAPLVGGAARAGEAGAIAARTSRLAPKVSLATADDFARVASWADDAGRVGKNAARDALQGKTVIVTRNKSGVPTAIASIEETANSVLIHNIASGQKGAGKALLANIAQEAKGKGKNVVSPEVASEAAAAWHVKQGFKPVGEYTSHVLDTAGIESFLTNFAKVSRSEARRLARKETRRPGFMASEGFEGGIVPRVGSTMALTPAARAAAKEVSKPGGGATLNANLTPHDISGQYVVAHGAYERTVPGKNLAREIQQYADDHAAILAEEGNKVGIWHPEDGRGVVLDVSRTFDNADDAMAFARREGQEAVFDGTTFEDIPTGLDPAVASGIKSQLRAASPVATVGFEALRPWSRSTIGRSGQQVYDNMSTRFGDSMFRGVFGGKFTPGHRAARVFEKTERRGRQHFAAWLQRRERVIHKATRDKPERFEALLAVLEAPEEMGFRLAVQTKRTHLSMRDNPPPLIAQQIKLLDDALEGTFLESGVFENAVVAARQLSDMADHMAGPTLGMSPYELARRRDSIAQEWVNDGAANLSQEAGIVVTRGSTLDEVLDMMGARHDWNKIIQADPDGSLWQYDPMKYTRAPDPATRQPVTHVFRAMSEEEWQVAKARGFFESDGRMNLSPTEGTVAALDNPSFYLPGKLASSEVGLYKGRIVKFRLQSEDGWIRDRDGYIKSQKKIPLSSVDEISPTLVGRREIRLTEGGQEVPQMPDFQPVPVIESTRARGYFPHRSIYDPARSVTPNASLPGGGVVGIPQKGKVFTRKQNELKRYYEGTVDTRPQSLAYTLRGRDAYLAKVSARQYLYELGRPVRPGEPVPEGWYFVRDPFGDMVRLRAEVKAAVADPESALVKHDPYVMKRDSFFAAQDAKALPPDWAKAVENVRMVPPELVKAVLSDATKGSGNVHAALGLMNAITRSVILHLPYGGTRYVARNTAQNLLLMAVTHPTSFLELVRSTAKLWMTDRALFDRIQVESGTIQAGMGLPEVFRGGTPLQRLERGVAQGKDFVVPIGERNVVVNPGLKDWGQKLGWLADEPYRVSAWIKYAKEYGFKDKAAWERLLNSKDPAMVEVRSNISQYVREDMIDFDTLNPYEREVVSRVTFIYPFIKGASKWPLVFVRDYPFRAGVIALIGAQGRREGIPGMPQTETEINTTGDTKWAWLLPHDPLFQNLQSGIALINGFKGGQVDLTPLTDFGAPWLRSFGTAGFGGGITYENLAKTFVPGYTTYVNTSRGGSLEDQFGRMMGYRNEPYGFRQREREEEKTKVLADWELSGENYYADEVGIGFRLKQEYKDFRARADFAAKDLGRKVTKKEQARLLTYIILKYRPDADVYSDEELLAGKNFDEYIDYLEDIGWGELTRLQRAASRARSDANG